MSVTSITHVAKAIPDKMDNTNFEFWARPTSIFAKADVHFHLGEKENRNRQDKDKFACTSPEST